LRLPAVLAGVLSVWAVFWLGKQVLDRRQAIIAAALLTVSYHHVWFSQNARGYTGLLLFTLVATGLFVEGMRRPARGLWLLYAISFAAAMYVHLTAVFVFAAHGLVYIGMFAKGRFGRSAGAHRESYPGAVELWPLVGFGLGLLLTLQLYAIILPQAVQVFSMQSGQESVNVKVAAWKSPVWTVLEAIRSLQPGYTSLAALVGVGLLTVVGLLRLAKVEPVFVALITLNVPLTLAALLAIDFHIWPRYFFVNIGFGTLIVVSGAFCVGDWLAERRSAGGSMVLKAQRLGTAIAAVVIVGSVAMLPRNYRLPKQDYSGARDFVEAERSEQDAVLTLGLMTSFPYRELYAPTWTSVSSVAEVENAVRNGGRPWLVYTFPTYVASVHADVLAQIRSDFELVREFPGSVGDGTIFVWRRRAR